MSTRVKGLLKQLEQRCTMVSLACTVKKGSCRTYLVYDIEVILQGLRGQMSKVLAQDVDKRLEERERVQRVHCRPSVPPRAGSIQNTLTVSAHRTQIPQLAAFDMAACARGLEIQPRNVYHWIDVALSCSVREGVVERVDV